METNASSDDLGPDAEEVLVVGALESDIGDTCVFQAVHLDGHGLG